MKIKALIEAIEQRIPRACAESWDPVGLVCGSGDWTLKKVTIGVDLTRALFEQALKQGANLIIIHHPPLFPKGRGLTHLSLGRPNELSTLLLEAFKKNVAIYVAHTNFDRCALDGMLDLADALNAIPVARLWETPDEGKTLLKKLVTYVPADHFERVRDALFAVGCGHIGNYDSCGFSTAGIGNFRPLHGATPTLGKIGELEQVDEVKIETLVVHGMEDVALEALTENHPYEEVAYDFYPVEQTPALKGMVWGLGYGFVATLPEPLAYEQFAKNVCKVFHVKSFLTQKNTPPFVKKIAFSPGKGSSFIKSVKAPRADVFITGEVGYHDSLSSARSHLNVIELGHRESELYFLKTIESWCKEWKVSAKSVDERTQQTFIL